MSSCTIYCWIWRSFDLDLWPFHPKISAGQALLSDYVWFNIKLPRTNTAGRQHDHFNILTDACKHFITDTGNQYTQCKQTITVHLDPSDPTCLLSLSFYPASLCYRMQPTLPPSSQLVDGTFDTSVSLKHVHILNVNIINQMPLSYLFLTVAFSCHTPFPVLTRGPFHFFTHWLLKDRKLHPLC